VQADFSFEMASNLLISRSFLKRIEIENMAEKRQPANSFRYLPVGNIWSKAKNTPASLPPSQVEEPKKLT
jgi:hypothetical protein